MSLSPNGRENGDALIALERKAWVKVPNKFIMNNVLNFFEEQQITFRLESTRYFKKIVAEKDDKLIIVFFSNLIREEIELWIDTIDPEEDGIRFKNEEELLLFLRRVFYFKLI